MIKTTLLAIWLTLLQTTCPAQKFKEWFRQNKTQREYLQEQIVQLKLYLDLTKEGYKIAKEGLQVIHQIKNSEFTLHKNRFDSLRIVKSGITSLSRLRHITDLHGRINEICERLPSEIAGCQLLDANMRTQMLTALQSLYDDCQVLISGFFMVIRNDQVSMTDNERIRRIEQFYQEFEAGYLFAQGLRSELGLVCVSAAREKEDIENRRSLKGIK